MSAGRGVDENKNYRKYHLLGREKVASGLFLVDKTACATRNAGGQQKHKTERLTNNKTAAIIRTPTQARRRRAPSPFVGSKHDAPPNWWRSASFVRRSNGCMPRDVNSRPLKIPVPVRKRSRQGARWLTGSRTLKCETTGTFRDLRARCARLGCNLVGRDKQPQTTGVDSNQASHGPYT